MSHAAASVTAKQHIRERDGFARTGGPCSHCDGTGRVFNDALIGQHMRHRRQTAGVSVRQAARRLNFTPSYLCDLESGRRRWSQRLVDAYLAVTA